MTMKRTMTTHRYIYARGKIYYMQLSPQEQHMLRHHPHPLEAFYGIWALKESYTKAIGVGLYHELNQLNFYNSKEVSKKKR